MNITINTDGPKLKIILEGVSYGVQDMPDSNGAKMLMFGDEKLDILIPLDEMPARKIGTKLAAKAVTVVKAGITNISDLRKDKQNGS